IQLPATSKPAYPIVWYRMSLLDTSRYAHNAKMPTMVVYTKVGSVLLTISNTKMHQDSTYIDTHTYTHI
ncbi:hypothetical protein, partial [Candidatus Cardinium hertigii]|uniref:hypothetical protein n=1 Tax=Candidatus Cardinium hertigii TaxID=247481 RepID=UPI001FAA8868